jgi:hypothetical protein
VLGSAGAGVSSAREMAAIKVRLQKPAAISPVVFALNFILISL